ncbi:M24 family metallopeptidase [Caldisericum exile]|uniref:M24 family peptidase n=1 Tax=Caldisericum exile (strain DSM 21853 / NBRC 104410 / AZM16c01) TaxID=511051 RepID=A0A7U6JEX5_CALEA|nr:aminopeptidase P family protein [Caldisericum exile]BAL81186.1 putative M24 family peptidase [Caldisericum exile AZM16c01]
MQKLFEKIENTNVDALFVSKIQNVRYITHFTGEEGFAIIIPPKIYLLVDSRFTEQAHLEVKESVEVVEWSDLKEAISSILTKNKVHFLAIEEGSLKFSTYKLLSQLGFLVLVGTFDLIEEIRMIKEDWELEKIRTACDISTKAFLETLKFLKEGISELEISAELEYRFKKFGGEKPSFDTIVASGERGALPHGVASKKHINAHEPIVFDFGVFFEGFASDTTRVVSIGEVSQEVRDVYKVLMEAQRIGREVAKEGILASNVDKTVRDFLSEKGFGSYFTHGLGHGVGLEIHELPYVNARSKYTLLRNMVITIEPGLYFPNKYGLRLEDTVIVKEDSIENLIDLPHEIIVV